MARSSIWTALGVAVIIVVIVGALIYYQMTLNTPSQSQMINVNITLYEGDSVGGAGILGAFGFSQSNLTSPGPTLAFKVGDVVNITVYNVGSISHNWAIVSSTSPGLFGDPVLFNVHVASGDNPLTPGQHGHDVFQVTQAGNFYYICQVPSHVDLGMWGNVIVT